MALTPPLVIVNYKLYPNAVGRRAIELTRTLEAAAGDRLARLAVCPALTDTAAVANACDATVIAQHCTSKTPGSGTGHILAEALADVGAKGSLINHAERQLDDNEIRPTIQRLREVGLTSIVCTSDADATGRLAAYSPDYVAVEPPDLIGGDISVTTADPDIIARSVDAANNVSKATVLCGAGIKTGNDVAAATKLGTRGVLVASGVVKAKDPGAALKDLLDGLERGA